MNHHPSEAEQESRPGRARFEELVARIEADAGPLGLAVASPDGVRCRIPARPRKVDASVRMKDAVADVLVTMSPRGRGVLPSLLVGYLDLRFSSTAPPCGGLPRGRRAPPVTAPTSTLSIPSSDRRTATSGRGQRWVRRYTATIRVPSEGRQAKTSSPTGSSNTTARAVNTPASTPSTIPAQRRSTPRSTSTSRS